MDLDDEDNDPIVRLLRAAAAKLNDAPGIRRRLR
jgi:hypothetical protein